MYMQDVYDMLIVVPASGLLRNVKILRHSKGTMILREFLCIAQK